MTKIVIGMVLAGLAFHYFPTESHSITSKAGAIVHESANKLSDATKPKSEFEQAIEKITK
jgi:hypothetical protein